MSIAALTNSTLKASPTIGFVVHSVNENRSIVSVLEDGSTTWCLGLYPTPAGHTRLVSRWSPNLDMTLVTIFLTMYAEPGTVMIERTMLQSVCDRTAREEHLRESVGQHGRDP